MKRKRRSVAATRQTPDLHKSKEKTMSIEYLLVTFPDERSVKADGNNVGFTNHTLMLPADEYLISLDGEGYQPADQDVVLAGTSVMKPMVVAFSSTKAARPAKKNA